MQILFLNLKAKNALKLILKYLKNTKKIKQLLSYTLVVIKKNILEILMIFLNQRKPFMRVTTSKTATF